MQHWELASESLWSEKETLSENQVRPANQDVEQHGKEDDGHGGGNGDQHHLAALTGDGEGCWRTESNR